MVYLNYFPPSVAGVNFWFFTAVLSGGGCWYYTKCEMVLCKIDGRMNLQNCGYFTKLWNGDGGDWCSTADGNGSCHGFTPYFFEEMTRCRHQKHRQRWPSNPNSLLNFRKYRAYLMILRLRDHDWCSAADGNGSCHGLAQLFLERWHIADVKNISGDDQATLMVDQNSAKYRAYLTI